MSKIEPPGYPDVIRIAQAFVKAAPECGQRLAPSERAERSLPDDALLFDLLAVWAPDESTRKRILLDNPENLYGLRNRRDLLRAFFRDEGAHVTEPFFRSWPGLSRPSTPCLLKARQERRGCPRQSADMTLER